MNTSTIEFSKKFSYLYLVAALLFVGVIMLNMAIRSYGAGGMKIFLILANVFAASMSLYRFFWQRKTPFAVITDGSMTFHRSPVITYTVYKNDSFSYVVQKRYIGIHKDGKTTKIHFAGITKEDKVRLADLVAERHAAWADVEKISE